MKEAFFWSGRRSLGLLVCAWLLGACTAPEEDGGAQAAGAEGYWSAESEPRPSRTRVLRQSVGPGPDFEVTQVSGPTAVSPTQAFSVDVVVCNVGDTPDSAEVGLYLSVDGTLTPDDQAIGSGFVYLPPGGCDFLQLPVEGGLPEGEWVLGAIADPQQSIVEGSEDNNARVGGPLAVTLLPDMVVSEVSGPAAVVPYAYFSVTLTACNQGAAPAQNIPLRAYLSPDDTITATDNLLGEASVSFLPPGECASREVWVSGMPELQGFLGAVTDPSDFTRESNEDNNVLTGEPLIVGHGPDLVARLRSAPTNVLPGQSLKVALEVCNQGTSFVGDFSVGVAHSVDEVIDPSDPWVGGAFLNRGLLPGECYPVEVSGSFSAPSGVYVLGTVVDVNNAHPELREDNNARAGLTLGVGFAPDLVVTSVAGPPNLPAHGGTLSGPALVTVCNRGTLDANGFFLEVLQSADATITGADLLAGNVFFPPLDVGACNTQSVNISLTVPQGQESSFFLGAIADTAQEVAELQEGNNARMGHRFALGQRPDYVVTGVRAPTSAVPGDSIPVSVTVCNEGTAAGQGSFPVAVVRSLNAHINASDIILGQVDFWPLAPRECATRRVTVPMNGPSGVSYLGAVADPDNFSHEFFEDNNSALGPRLDVGNAPDLVVRAVHGPASARPGEPFPTRVTVCNEGPQDSGPSTVELLLSLDNDVFWNDQAIGGASIPPLAAGRCHTLDVSGWAGASQALFTLGAVIDPSDAIAELREDNNIAKGGALGMGGGPDYVVSAVEGPPSTQPGQTLSVPVTVCNQGTQGGSSTSVEVFQSSSEQPGPVGPRIGGAHVPPLGEGQCASVIVSGPTVQDKGPFTLVAVVDPQSMVSELHEGNNVRQGRRFGVGNGPDLVVKEVRGPSTVLPGATFAASVTVCNEGTSSMSQASLDVVLSADASLDFRDIRVGGASLPLLAPGQCTSQNFQATAYHDARGPHFLGAFLHPGSSDSELFEDNNFQVGTPLFLGSAPDLAITAFSGPPFEVEPGMPVSAQVTICNHGTVPTPSQEVALFQSGDATINAQDFYLTVAAVPSLQPGVCSTVTLSGSATGPDGTYVLGAIVDPWDNLEESQEDNNTFGTVAASQPRSDLTVTAVSAPALAKPGAAFTAEVTVCNVGSLRAQGSFITLLLSSDDVLSGGDFSVGGRSLPDIEPGQCFTVPVSASAQAPSGNYRLIGRADSSSGDGRTENNVRLGGTLSVSSRSLDLALTAVTPPLNVAPSGYFATTVRVCNPGTISTPTSRLELFFSADATISRTADTKVAEVSFGSVAPGGCREQQVTARASVAGGLWWVGAVVDGTNGIPEANEANNTLASEPVRVGSGPDLVVTQVGVPTGAVAPQSGFTASVQVCNRGTQSMPASSWLELVLSADAFISDEDPKLTVQQFSPLSAGACRDFTVNAPIPSGAVGTWYVGARVDGPNAIAELREDNNVHIQAQVVVGSGPNLVITSVNGPSAVRQGAFFGVDAEVCNLGTLSAPSSQVAFVLSGDPSIGPPDHVLAQVSVPSLGSGMCQQVGVATVSSGWPEGAIFTLGAVVDLGGSLAELREDDNARAGARLQFDNKPPSTPSISSTSPNVQGNTTSPYVMGSTEPGAKVHIYTDSACSGTAVGAGTASTLSGSFSVQSTAQANTTTTFYARATDAAGNTSTCSAGRAYTHDGVAPAVPVLTGTTPGSPGTSTQPAFQGTAEPGTTVRLFTVSTCTGTLAASGTADSGGAFSIAVTVPANTTTTVYASAADAAGNASPCSAGLAYTHQDEAPPLAP